MFDPIANQYVTITFDAIFLNPKYGHIIYQKDESQEHVDYVDALLQQNQMERPIVIKDCNSEQQLVDIINDLNLNGFQPGIYKPGDYNIY